jgi:hypothetical protein
MSELKVNKVSPATGTAITLGDSGDTFTVPSGCTIVNSGTATGFGGGGKVVQFVHTAKTDTFSTSASDTWTDITGLSVTTASLATTGSKVLVLVSMNVVTMQDYTHARVVDGAGNIIVGFVGDTAGSRNRASFSNWYSGDGNVVMETMSASLYDSPSSTSAQTYKVQVYSNSGTVYLNRAVTDADTDNYARSVSTISAMEIGA